MDRYIVDLLLNEDNSPFNSKNFKIIEFEKMTMRKYITYSIKCTEKM